MAGYIRQLKDNEGEVYPALASGQVEATHIKDKTVTGAKIADATVTQGNINWSTISYVEDTTFKSGAQKTVNTTRSSIATLTVPVGGVYLITLSFDINAQGYYLADSNINITAGSTSLVDRYINNNARDYWLGGFSTTVTATLTAGTVVTAYSKTSQNQYVIPAGGSRRHFSAVRIA